MSEHIQMKGLTHVIYVVRPFVVKTTFETTDTSIQRKNLSNAATAERDSANPEPWLCTKYFIMKNLPIDAQFAKEVLIKGQI